MRREDRLDVGECPHEELDEPYVWPDWPELRSVHCRQCGGDLECDEAGAVVR